VLGGVQGRGVVAERSGGTGEHRVGEHRVGRYRGAVLVERSGGGAARAQEAPQLGEHTRLAYAGRERAAGGRRLGVRVDRLAEEALALERQRRAEKPPGAVATAGERAAHGRDRAVVLADGEQRVGVGVRRRRSEGRRLGLGRGERLLEQGEQPVVGGVDVPCRERRRVGRGRRARSGVRARVGA
jgi:hypothetical protein